MLQGLHVSFLATGLAQVLKGAKLQVRDFSPRCSQVPNDIDFSFAISLPGAAGSGEPRRQGRDFCCAIPLS